jgi:hypothetical protein
MSMETTVINLSDSRPVRIKLADWPRVVDVANDTDHNNQELNRRHYIRVHQHADGRAIVYGWRESSWQGEHGVEAGYRCDQSDVPEKINQVGEAISAPTWLIQEAISDLPPQDI